MGQAGSSSVSQVKEVPSPPELPCDTDEDMKILARCHLRYDPIVHRTISGIPLMISRSLCRTIIIQMQVWRISPVLFIHRLSHAWQRSQTAAAAADDNSKTLSAASSDLTDKHESSSSSSWSLMWPELQSPYDNDEDSLLPRIACRHYERALTDTRIARLVVLMTLHEWLQLAYTDIHPFIHGDGISSHDKDHKVTTGTATNGTMSTTAAAATTIVVGTTGDDIQRWLRQLFGVDRVSSRDDRDMDYKASSSSSSINSSSVHVTPESSRPAPAPVTSYVQRMDDAHAHVMTSYNERCEREYLEHLSCTELANLLYHRVTTTTIADPPPCLPFPVYTQPVPVPLPLPPSMSTTAITLQHALDTAEAQAKNTSNSGGRAHEPASGSSVCNTFDVKWSKRFTPLAYAATQTEWSRLYEINNSSSNDDHDHTKRCSIIYQSYVRRSAMVNEVRTTIDDIMTSSHRCTDTTTPAGGTSTAGSSGSSQEVNDDIEKKKNYNDDMIRAAAIVKRRETYEMDQLSIAYARAHALSTYRRSMMITPATSSGHVPPSSSSSSSASASATTPIAHGEPFLQQFCITRYSGSTSNAEEKVTPAAAVTPVKDWSPLLPLPFAIHCPDDLAPILQYLFHMLLLTLEPRDIIPDDTITPSPQFNARIMYVFDIRHRIMAWLLCTILGHNDATERGKRWRSIQMLLLNYSTNAGGSGCGSGWGVPADTTQIIINYFMIGLCYEIWRHPQMQRLCRTTPDDTNASGVNVMMRVFGKPGTTDGGEPFVQIVAWSKWLTSIMNDEPSTRDTASYYRWHGSGLHGQATYMFHHHMRDIRLVTMIPNSIPSEMLATAVKPPPLPSSSCSDVEWCRDVPAGGNYRRDTLLSLSVTQLTAYQSCVPMTMELPSNDSIATRPMATTSSKSWWRTEGFATVMRVLTDPAVIAFTPDVMNRVIRQRVDQLLAMTKS